MAELYLVTIDREFIEVTAPYLLYFLNRWFRATMGFNVPYTVSETWPIRV